MRGHGTFLSHFKFLSKGMRLKQLSIHIVGYGHGSEAVVQEFHIVNQTERFRAG